MLYIIMFPILLGSHVVFAQVVCDY